MNLRGRETEEERTKGGREGARFFQIIRQTTDLSLALVDISSELPEAPLSSGGRAIHSIGGGGRHNLRRKLRTERGSRGGAGEDGQTSGSAR